MWMNEWKWKIIISCTVGWCKWKPKEHDVQCVSILLFFPPLINQSVFSLPVPNPRQLLNQTRLNALSATFQCDVIRQRYAGEMLRCVIFLFFFFLFYYNWTMIRTCFFFISLPVKMCSFYRWCEWSPKKKGKKSEMWSKAWKLIYIL